MPRLLNDTFEAITKGDDNGNRDGVKIFVQSVELRFLLTKTSTTDYSLRFIHFYSRDIMNGGHYEDPGVLAPSFYQPLELPFLRKFEVIKDDLFDPNRDFGGYAYRRWFTFKYDINKVYTYTSGTTLRTAPKFPMIIMATDNPTLDDIELSKLNVMIRYKDI